MTTRASIEGALLAMLARLGGKPLAPDQPAGMTAAQVAGILDGETAPPPEFFALVPLGYWFCDMIAFFGGRPSHEAAGPAASQLLAQLRGPEEADGGGRERYLGEVLWDILGALPPNEEIERIRRKRRTEVA